MGPLCWTCFSWITLRAVPIKFIILVQCFMQFITDSLELRIIIQLRTMHTDPRSNIYSRYFSNFCISNIQLLHLRIVILGGDFTGRWGKGSNKETLTSQLCLRLGGLYGPFLWIGFNCLKARAPSRRQFAL